MVAEPNISPSKKVILWLKGNLTLGSYLPKNCLNSNLDGKDAVSLALRISWYFLFHFKRRWITLEEWKNIASQKLKFNSKFSYFLFTIAKGFEETSLEREKADMLLLAFSLAFQSSQISESGVRNSCNFVKSNLEKLLTLSFIFDSKIQEEFICCSQLQELPKIDLVDAKLLSLCDHFLEGTFTEKDDASTKIVNPFTFSDIVLKCWTDDGEKISFSKLLLNTINSLQSDMYTLDEFEIKSKKLPITTSTRSITSTILSQHRKLSVRNWSHMEILNNSIYRSINLRISDGNNLLKSSFIFHLSILKTVVISDCSDISPIVLGPVMDFVILRNLHNCRISVITKRITIIDCDNLLLFVNLETNPIIVGISTSICFAPYNVWFNALEYELAQANLSLQNETYSNPIFVDSCYKKSKKDKDKFERFQILPEEDFYLQPTPLQSSLPYSKSFIQSLGNYLTRFLKRRISAENYLTKLTMPEIEMLAPLSTDDLHYLKKKVSSRRK